MMTARDLVHDGAAGWRQQSLRSNHLAPLHAVTLGDRRAPSTATSSGTLRSAFRPAWPTHPTTIRSRTPPNPDDRVRHPLPVTSSSSLGLGGRRPSPPSPLGSPSPKHRSELSPRFPGRRASFFVSVGAAALGAMGCTPLSRLAPRTARIVSRAGVTNDLPSPRPRDKPAAPWPLGPVQKHLDHDIQWNRLSARLCTAESEIRALSAGMLFTCTALPARAANGLTAKPAVPRPSPERAANGLTAKPTGPRSTPPRRRSKSAEAVTRTVAPPPAAKPRPGAPTREADDRNKPKGQRTGDNDPTNLPPRIDRKASPSPAAGDSTRSSQPLKDRGRSGRPLLFIWAPPWIRESGVISVLRANLSGIEIRAFSRQESLLTAIRMNPPDAIMSLGNRLKPWSREPALEADFRPRQDLHLVSIDAVIPKARWSTVTYGIVDYGDRTQSEAFVAHVLQLRRKPKLRRVSKVDDLLPLLQFKMADAVLVRTPAWRRLQRRTRLNLRAVRIAEPPRRLAVTFPPGGRRRAIERRLLELNPRARAQIGIERWVRHDGD